VVEARTQLDAAQKKIDELEKKKTEVSEKIKKLIASFITQLLNCSMLAYIVY
jgi:hypothetical protein